MRRAILITCAVLLLLVVAAVLLLPLFLDREKVLAMATQAVQEQTGATLAVSGDLELSLFPTLGVSFSGASITMEGSSRPDLEIGAAEIGVQLLPLLSRQVEIDTISVNGLTARVVAAPPAERVDTSGYSDAELDAWYAQRRREREAAGQAAGAEAALAVPLALNVSSLEVADARVETLDPATGQTSVLELRSLQASGLNLEGAPIPLALVLHVPGETPLDIAAEGEIAIAADSDTLSFEEIRLDISGATAEPVALTLAGTADLGRQSANVNLLLELGPTRGDGTLRYASFESPQIDANLDLNLLDPALLALAGPEAADAADGETAAASGDEPLPLDALRAIDTRAALRVESARFGAHTIENLSLRLRALEGVIELSEVSGRLHGGQLAAVATFDGRHNIAQLRTQGGLDALDIATALAAMESAPVLSGSASLDWELAAQGGTVNALTAALAGPVKLATTDIVLHGTSVERLLCRAVALTNNEKLTSTFEPDTHFTELYADVVIAGGEARLSPLRAELEAVRLSGSGSFDLLAQDFDATFKARLSPGLEELDPACRVSKRLTAIDFPVNCRGEVSAAPGDWCKVDAEKIVTDLALSEGKRKLEKKAGKLFNKLLGGDKDEE